LAVGWQTSLYAQQRKSHAVANKTCLAIPLKQARMRDDVSWYQDSGRDQLSLHIVNDINILTVSWADQL
jgi:hypothetical protein